MTGAIQREGLVQYVRRIGDHPGAATGVIARAFFCSVGLRNDICAIERIIQAAPAGISCVQRKTRIHDRDDELRACCQRNLGIHVLGRDFEIWTFLKQVADLIEKRSVLSFIYFLAGMGAMPFINLRLQRVTFCQQFSVARHELIKNRFQFRPEMGRLDTGTRCNLIFQEFLQYRSNLQPTNRHSLCHREIPLFLRFNYRLCRVRASGRMKAASYANSRLSA